jgi:hypothetical protein
MVSSTGEKITPPWIRSKVTRWMSLGAASWQRISAALDRMPSIAQRALVRYQTLIATPLDRVSATLGTS